MTPLRTRLDAVLAGAVSVLADGKTPSAMGKRPLDGAAEVGAEGLLVDIQADRTVHGGTDKALLHYAFDHYAAWIAEGAGDPARLSAPGAFGENLSTRGITEADVAIGDVLRIGGVVVEVSQGRQPCFKLDVFHGRPDMAYRVRATGRTGWYYRVREGGRIAAGDAVTLLERPHPDWPLTRAQAVFWARVPDRDETAALAALPALADAWRRPLRKRLGD